MDQQPHHRNNTVADFVRPKQYRAHGWGGSFAIGFGKHRAILICSSCGGGAIRLFGRYGNYACRYCHRAQYLSQKQKTASRKRLTAAKLRLKLGGWPDIREPLPPKAKWKHHKRYQKLRNQIQELEAQANRTRFRKQIDIRTFAYHVG